MKILFITEFFPTGKDLRFSGGVEARTFFVAKHLAKRHKVTVICKREIGSTKVEKMSGFKVYRVGSLARYTSGIQNFLDCFTMLGFIHAAIRLGKNLDVDIVDGTNFDSHLIAKQISKNKHIPVVFWYPDVFIGKWLTAIGFPGGFNGWILEKFNLARSADNFIAISKSTAKKLKKNSVPEEKISLISCGVDLKEFKITVLKSHPTSLICISRLVHYKRVSDLIWAFGLLLKKNFDIKLIIVGQGPEEKKLSNLCQMLNISHRITFLKNLPRKDLIKTLKSANLFCLPSGVEGFGITVIEAAAASVPYVVSDIDVFREITKNGQGGLFFKLGDIKDLSSKIEKLLTDKNLYQKKSKEGLDLAKKYQWSKIAHQTEILYKSLYTKNTQWRKNGIHPGQK